MERGREGRMEGRKEGEEEGERERERERKEEGQKGRNYCNRRWHTGKQGATKSSVPLI